MNLKTFSVSSAVRIPDPKAQMLKVEFYRSLYTIIHLFNQFFILQTNYRTAKSSPNIVLATKHTEEKKQLTQILPTHH